MDASLITAITNLIVVLGTKNTIIIVLILMCYMAYHNFKTSKEGKFYYNSMLKEKNKEIEKLADEARRYRDIYLRSVGLEAEDLRKTSAIEATRNK